MLSFFNELLEEPPSQLINEFDMRHLIISISLALPFCALAAEEPVTAAQPKELKIYFGRGVTRSSIHAFADQFLAEKGINIVDVQTPKPQEDMNADIYCNSHELLWDLYTKGLLQPIHPSANIRSESFTLGWDALSSKGQYYGYPLAMETTVLVYNKDLIDTVPKSFEEFAELDIQLKKSKQISAIDWNYTNSRLSWTLMSAGGQLIFGRDENNNFDPNQNGANTPNAIAGAIFIKKWVDQSILPPLSTEGTAEKRFADGKVAAILIEPSSWVYLKGSSINWGIAHLPTINGLKATPLMNAWGCAIATKADTNIAKNFIEEYLLKRETLTALFRARSGGLSTQKEVFNKHEGQLMFKIINGGRPIPASEATERFWTNMDAALLRIIEGESPYKALDEAAENIARKP